MISKVPSSNASSFAPNRRRMMMLVTAAAATLSSVLPNRIEPSRRSTFASKRPVSFALRLPLRIRWFKRWRLSAIIPVSAAENHAPNTKSKSKMSSNAFTERSSKCVQQLKVGGFEWCATRCRVSSRTPRAVQIKRDARKHHRHTQPLSHADAEGHQAEDAVIGVAGELGDKTETAIAD